MNYRNSSIKTGSNPDLSLLRKNYLMSYQKFNSQFKPKTRNAFLHKPLNKVTYEYNDYDDMNSSRRNNSCISQKHFTGYGTKVQYILEDNSNHISDKIKCFKQGDNNEDVFLNTVSAKSDSVQDAVLALVSLGYSDMEALKAVRQIPEAESMDSEELLKAALKKIF